MIEARQAGVGGGSGLINASAAWDLNGNLSTRQDLNQSLTESFVYDSLDRLDYGQRNGSTNLDVTLDAIGNQSYHATKKRAVADLRSTADSAGQSGARHRCRRRIVRLEYPAGGGWQYERQSIDLAATAGVG